MKKILIFVSVQFFMFISIHAKICEAQDTDITLTISEYTVNNAVQTLVETKAFNFAEYNGFGWAGIRTLHINVNTVGVDLKQAPYPQENVELICNATARASLNFLALTFNVSVTGDFKIYGTTELNNEGTGYKINMRVLGLRDFSVTNTILDTYMIDALLKVLNRFQLLSFTPTIEILPAFASQYFTSPNPKVTVTNDAILLSSTVNEIYLANDIVTNAKNYESEYIEAGPDYVVAPTGNLELSSGPRGVKLIPGFNASHGSTFKASSSANLDFTENNFVNSSLLLPDKLYNVLDTAKENKSDNSTENIPHEFALDQNYPNPFNPATTIKFALPRHSQVRLIIYDIAGREIRRIVDSELSAGFYQYVFDGSVLSSGVYFYRLETAEFTSIKKMMLIK